jgi:hypothetical protein
MYPHSTAEVTAISVQKCIPLYSNAHLVFKLEFCSYYYPKRDYLMMQWKKLHKERHNLCSSQILSG